MNLNAYKITFIIVFCIIALAHVPIQGQQFSSDNYLSKPHGVATIILTYGERNSMLMNTFSLFPRWEFTAAFYIMESIRILVVSGRSHRFNTVLK